MKTKIQGLLALVPILFFSLCIVSCSGEDDTNGNTNDNKPNIVDGIDLSLIPGIYEFNGNIAPSFILYKDGTCDIQTNGTNSTITTEKWTYEKTTHVLLVGTHVYTIKLLDKENLAAEWTSVKYESSVSSWKRSELPGESSSGAAKDKLDGHEYVEIGGVKWSTMNLGATTVAGAPRTCYGDYFAWGETEPRYKSIKIDGNNSATFGGWKSDHSEGYSLRDYPKNKVFSAQYDAASQTWGSNWRMPMESDFIELFKACGSSVTYGIKSTSSKGIYWCNNYDGVKGLLFCDGTNKLFLPASGDIDETEFKNGGIGGSYWTSSTNFNSAASCYVYKLQFYKTGFDMKKGLTENTTNSRYLGYSIRPVGK